MRPRRGFTLVELLAVLSIVAIVSSVLLPTFSVAKRRSKVEVAKTYLREQFLCLATYAIDADDYFPSHPAVLSDPHLQAPCSSLDTWRKPCWSRPSPMLGSFGYSGALAEGELPAGFRDGGTYPLLADIFTSDYQVREFSGSEPQLADCARFHGCDFPKQIWFAYSDGTLKVWRGKSPNVMLAERGVWLRQGFTWPTAFLRASSLK
jgi:prepilin-type N-terminal cleavage/methylation domain-containing protein